MYEKRRFLLDNDGSNITHNLGDDVEGAVQDVVRECPSEVTTFLLCSGAGSCNWPTKVCHVDGRAKGLLAAHERGLDPLGMVLKGIKSIGKETFITYRMNDVHNPTDEDQANVPRIRRENPDCIVGMDEVEAGKADWMSYCLDYSREDVRQFKLDLIQEQIDLYGEIIDGFQLDWMRFPRHLSGSPEEVWDKRESITEFTEKVREILHTSGKKILLSARVPTTPAGCRYLGFDLAEWSHRKLLDMLVICPFLSTEWLVPVDDFKSLAGDNPIPIYAGFDFCLGNQCHFPESLRGICTTLYDAGSDGIYVFNFPCWNEYLAARPYHWFRGLEDPESASIKPPLLAVEHKRHRIAEIDQEGHVPAQLPGNATLDLTLQVPPSALPAWRALFLIHSHGDIALAINGHPANDVRSDQESKASFRSEIFMEFTNQYWDKDGRPKPEDCRTFRLAPEYLREGRNDLVLTNLTEEAIEIERVNLGLW